MLEELSKLFRFIVFLLLGITGIGVTLLALSVFLIPLINGWNAIISSYQPFSTIEGTGFFLSLVIFPLTLAGMCYSAEREKEHSPENYQEWAEKARSPEVNYRSYADSFSNSSILLFIGTMFLVAANQEKLIMPFKHTVTHFAALSLGLGLANFSMRLVIFYLDRTGLLFYITKITSILSFPIAKMFLDNEKVAKITWRILNKIGNEKSE